MNQNELELWQKIQLFEFDSPNTQLTFAKRLARENNFTLEFSNQVIFEYKKFIFLCCVSEQQITPSHCVDLAWHSHLTYTKSYWTNLCKNTIQRELHHNPTEGGKSESIKFKNYYNNTLHLYQCYFTTEAPKSIWQNETDRFKNTILNVNKSENWIIPKPNLVAIKSKFSYVTFTILSSIVFVCCNQSSAVAIPIVFAVGFVLIVIYGQDKKNERPTSTDSDSGMILMGDGSDSHLHLDGQENDNENGEDGNDSSDGGSDGGGGCSGCGGGD